VSPGCRPEIDHRAFDDPTLGEQGSHPREVPPVPDYGCQQPGLVGSRHRSLW
jgi:hypothetical protein